MLKRTYNHDEIEHQQLFLLREQKGPGAGTGHRHCCRQQHNTWRDKTEEEQRQKFTILLDITRSQKKKRWKYILKDLLVAMPFWTVYPVNVPKAPKGKRLTAGTGIIKTVQGKEAAGTKIRHPNIFLQNLQNMQGQRWRCWRMTKNQDRRRRRNIRTSCGEVMIHNIYSVLPGQGSYLMIMSSLTGYVRIKTRSVGHLIINFGLNVLLPQAISRGNDYLKRRRRQSPMAWHTCIPRIIIFRYASTTTKNHLQSTTKKQKAQNITADVKKE